MERRDHGADELAEIASAGSVAALEAFRSSEGDPFVLTELAEALAKLRLIVR